MTWCVASTVCHHSTFFDSIIQRKICKIASQPFSALFLVCQLLCFIIHTIYVVCLLKRSCLETYDIQYQIKSFLKDLDHEPCMHHFECCSMCVLMEGEWWCDVCQQESKHEWQKYFFFRISICAYHNYTLILRCFQTIICLNYHLCHSKFFPHYHWHLQNLCFTLRVHFYCLFFWEHPEVPDI